MGDSRDTAAKILFLCADEKNIRGSVRLLEKNQHTVHVTKSLSAALDQIDEFDPDVVLLSWNLKGVDVKRLYAYFTQKLDLVCIVFAEEASSKTAITLMNSGIHDHIMAPVSGGSFHTKIQSLLHGAATGVLEKIFTHEKLVVVQPEDVPGAAVWEKAQSVIIGAHTVWKATHHDQDKKKSHVYYFKGPEQPVFDADAKVWRGFEKSKSPIFMQERALGEEFSITQTANETPMVGALQQGGVIRPSLLPREQQAQVRRQKNETLRRIRTEMAPESVTSQGSVEKIEDDQTAGSSENEGLTVLAPERLDTAQVGPPLSFLEQRLRQSLVGVHSEFAGLAPTLFLGRLLSGARFCGYLLIGLQSAKQRLAAEQYLAEFVKDLGSDTSERTRDLKLEFPWKRESIAIHIQNHAQMALAAQLDGEPCVVSFWDVKAVPPTLEPHTPEAKAKNLLGILMEKSIAVGTDLLFDVFLDLERNHKIILYHKAGDHLDQKAFDKMINHGMKELYIHAEDLSKFISYCAWGRASLTAPFVD